MTRRRTPRRSVLAAFTLLAVSACSGSGGGDVADPSLQPQASATIEPTADSSATATPAVTPTTKPKPKPTPTRPVKVPATDGDIDGDGLPDRVSVAPVPVADGIWSVTLKLSALGTRSGQVHADTEQPRLVGIVDADGDGFGEVFLTVAQGASTSFWGVLRLVDGVVRETTMSGQPLHLAIGGSVTHGDGFACAEEVKASRGRELLVYTGDTFDGTTWDGTVTTYAWVGGAVREIRQRTERFPTGASGDDPRMRPYYDADCGSLSAEG